MGKCVNESIELDLERYEGNYHRSWIAYWEINNVYACVKLLLLRAFIYFNDVQ